MLYLVHLQKNKLSNLTNVITDEPFLKARLVSIALNAINSQIMRKLAISSLKAQWYWSPRVEHVDKKNLLIKEPSWLSSTVGAMKLK